MTRSLDDIARLAAKRHDESTAQRDAALSALASLVAIIRRECGYLSQADQDALRQARSILADAGRSVP